MSMERIFKIREKHKIATAGVKIVIFKIMS